MVSHLKHLIFNTINIFGKASGYKINESKSAILFLKHSERLRPTIRTPFKVVSESFTYLCIKMTPKIGNLVPTNYDVMTVTESIKWWSLLPIFMIRRINVLKMNVIPKLLYFFQAIPLSPPINFLQKWELFSVSVFGIRDVCLCYISLMTEEAWASSVVLLGCPTLYNVLLVLNNNTADLGKREYMYSAT